jgi:uncharacterized protein YkwD
MRHLSRLVLLIVSFLLIFSVQVVVTSAGSTEEAALSVIAQMNEWRIRDGLWPLKQNDTLVNMALYQAQYLMTLPELPSGGAIHDGPSGEDPQKRALLPQFNWPTYGTDDQISVQEIAYAGRSAVQAIDYWKNSTVHRHTVENSYYREVGVAALPHRFGFLFIVVVGGRPDVLTTLADTQSGLLYLSNERFPYGDGNWLNSADRVRLFDSEGKPIQRDWMQWQATLPIPQGVTDSLFVEYSSGDTSVLSPVNLKNNGVVLPAHSVPIVADTSTANQTSSPDEIERSSPHTVATVEPTTTPVTVAPTAVPAGTQASASTTTTSSAPPSLVLIYDRRSLTLMNATAGPLNVHDIRLVSGNLQFNVTRWQTQWLSGTLEALAGHDCLGAWSWLEPSVLPQPTDCRQRRGVIQIDPAQMIWANADFDVYRSDQLLAHCVSSAGRCAVIFQ